MRNFWTQQRQAQRTYLGALLVCLLALSGCQFPAQPTTKTVILPTLAKGWSWYSDSVYPFDLPVPPGWKALGFWQEYYTGDHCAREVELIPPQWLNLYQHDPEQIPETIILSIPTTCPTFVPARDNIHLQPAGSTMLGKAPASLYTDVEMDIDLDRQVVLATLSGHQYMLSFDDEQSATNQPFQQFDAGQVTIFNNVRENFNYHG